MLARAVECVPHSVDMWLALARLESYENARRVLNKAAQHLPSEPLIWVTAAQLEEAHGHHHVAEKVVVRAVKTLAASSAVIDRERWLREAESCEEAGYPITCAAIVRATVGQGVEDVDRKRTWLNDARSAKRKGRAATSRAIYAQLLAAFPESPALWEEAADLEKEHGTPESVDALLRRAVQSVPSAEQIWLRAVAHRRRVMRDVAGARGVLLQAFKACSRSSAIWLEAAALEWEEGDAGRSRELLARARERAPAARVWVKSALLEWEAGDAAAERELLAGGLAKFPEEPKLWLMSAQLEEEQGDKAAARRALHDGLRRCPDSVPMWLRAVQLERDTVGTAKARSLAELARMKCPRTPKLWLQAIKMEVGGARVARARAGALTRCVARSNPTATTRRRCRSCPRRCRTARPAGCCGRSRSRWCRGRSASASRSTRRRSAGATRCSCWRWPECSGRIGTRTRRASGSRGRWRCSPATATRGPCSTSSRCARAARVRAPRACRAHADAAALPQLEQGSEETQEAVAKKCEEVEPKYGETWAAVRKAKGNRLLPVRRILSMAAEAMESG